MRRPSTPLAPFVVATLLAVAHPAAAQTPPAPSGSVIELRDGSRVEGAVVSIHMGVDVTVRLPHGEQRTIPWSEVQNATGVAEVPAPGSPAPGSAGDVHVSLGVGPGNYGPPDLRREYLHPHAGTEPVYLEADGDPLMISAISGEDPVVVPFRHSAYSGFSALSTTLGEHTTYLCSTPCTVYLPPGGTTLHLSGPGQIAADVTLTSQPGGKRVLLYSTGMLRPVGGLLMSVAGGGFTLMGGLALALGASFGTSPGAPAAMSTTASTSRGTSASSQGDGSAMMVVGGVLLGVGVPLLTWGIHLVATTHTGVEREAALQAPPGFEPLAQRRPRLRLIGAGLAPTVNGHGVTGGVGFSF